MVNNRMDKLVRDFDYERIFSLVKSHPMVSSVEPPPDGIDRGPVEMKITFNVNLPNIWRKNGISPSGVKLQETAAVKLSPTFPLSQPLIYLRRDFNQNLPHFLPFNFEGHPIPCIFEGSLTELFFHSGFAGILNQLYIWLERAALNKLMDKKQGWEPVLRYTLSASIVCDADKIRQLANQNVGFKFFRVKYVRDNESGTKRFQGRLGNELAELSSNFFQHKVNDTHYIPGNSILFGDTVALVVWPSNSRASKAKVCSTYQPETVMNFEQLKERASIYNCLGEFNNAVVKLKKLAQTISKRPIPICVIFLVHRPYSLIGSNSSIELCPYVIDVKFPDIFNSSTPINILPTAHRSEVSRKLLQEVSGFTPSNRRTNWTLIGAGSLGSKLAVHLARAGGGPNIVVDSSNFSPHNSARHALMAEIDKFGLAGQINKANMLCQALSNLNHTSKPVPKNIANFLNSKDAMREITNSNTWSVVNTTASYTVRAALSSSKILRKRVVESCLFLDGEVSVITVEGIDRNPNTEFLMTEVYRLFREDENINRMFGENKKPMSQIQVGQGCSSTTMIMSDSKLSIHAASISEYLLKFQESEQTPKEGAILIGQLTDNGIGINWSSHTLPPVVKVKVLNSTDNWIAHISQHVLDKVDEDIIRYPSVETGGLIVGRFCEYSKVVYIVDILEPPVDSVRKPEEFLLGTQGGRQMLDEYSKSTNGALYGLGTWHNHLIESGPSRTDCETGREMSKDIENRTFMLIRTPKNSHVLMFDGIKEI